jgi:hypothetical protein
MDLLRNKGSQDTNPFDIVYYNIQNLACQVQVSTALLFKIAFLSWNSSDAEVVQDK